MAHIVTEQELAELERLRLESHMKHADKYASVDACKEAGCVQTKLGLEWLKRARKCFSGACLFVAAVAPFTTAIADIV